MLVIKAASDEKDLHPKMLIIQQYIEEQIVRYEQLARSMEDDRVADWKALIIFF